MNAVNRWSRVQMFALIVLSIVVSNQAKAEFPAVDADGWYTWRVTAAEDAANWCCYSWNSGVSQEKACDLDKGNGGFSSGNDTKNSSGELQIYALMKSGMATEIRPLSAQCAVSSGSTITDLGFVDVDDSVDQLRPYIGVSEDISSDTLAAIAAHAGSKSLRVLLDSARSGSDSDVREEAIFWAALVRGPEAASDIRKMMLEDGNRDFREHAAFAYSQSDIDDRTDALIELGNKDANGDVRSQAWFWLAQTGAQESEAAIFNAIANDASADVREEAVFALSQLPDERAVRALARILEDRNQDKDIREQALFWLAQSDSDTAFTYVDRLFAN